MFHRKKIDSAYIAVRGRYQKAGCSMGLFCAVVSKMLQYDCRTRNAHRDCSCSAMPPALCIACLCRMGSGPDTHPPATVDPTPFIQLTLLLIAIDIVDATANSIQTASDTGTDETRVLPVDGCLVYDTSYCSFFGLKMALAFRCGWGR